jgi:hypothetical protein
MDSSQTLTYVLLVVAFIVATLYIMRRRVRSGKRIGKF